MRELIAGVAIAALVGVAFYFLRPHEAPEVVPAPIEYQAPVIGAPQVVVPVPEVPSEVFKCDPQPSAYYVAANAGDDYLSLPAEVLACAEEAAHDMRKAEELYDFCDCHKHEK